MERVTIENGRAAYAYNAVDEFIQKHPDKKENYRSYIKRLPSIIQTNGLGQALAFYYSKGREHKIIYDQIYAWLKQKNKNLFNEPDEEFVKTVVNMDSRQYRVVTMEVLALLNWMRRFVEGRLKN